MVNYGYNSSTMLWKENKKYELAEALRKLLLDLNLTRNTEIEEEVVNHEFPEPYIEVDGLYEGVRIRKMTQLTVKQHAVLIKKADTIYLNIMGAIRPKIG